MQARRRATYQRHAAPPAPVAAAEPAHQHALQEADRVRLGRTLARVVLLHRPVGHPHVAVGARLSRAPPRPAGRSSAGDRQLGRAREPTCHRVRVNGLRCIYRECRLGDRVDGPPRSLRAAQPWHDATTARSVPFKQLWLTVGLLASGSLTERPSPQPTGVPPGVRPHP